MLILQYFELFELEEIHKKYRVLGPPKWDRGQTQRKCHAEDSLLYMGTAK